MMRVGVASTVVALLLTATSALAWCQGTFPVECNDWATLETPQDGAETFCNQDQHLDVIETHWFADADYLYLRMCLRAHGGWPVSGIPVDPYEEARYKWFIDTDGTCDLTRPGGQVTDAEFLLFVEDFHITGNPDDGLGEMYLIDDKNADDIFNEWEAGTPPLYTTEGPAKTFSTLYRMASATGQTPGATNQVSNAGDTADIGFAIDGPDPGTVDNDTGCCTYTVDMYVTWSALGLGGPQDICVMWASETETPNLDAAEVCDRHNDSTPLTGDADTGTIVIVKDANPADGTNFTFSGDLGGFTLDDADPDDIDGFPISKTVTGLAPDTYDVTEALPAGWKIDAITCCDCDPASGNTTASISVGPDQTVQCVFINEALPPPTTGTITVIKDSLPEADQDFNFTFAPPGGAPPVLFALDDADPDDGDGVVFSRVFSDLVPGTYLITETVPSGWTLSSITNDNDSNPSNGVTINLAAGDEVFVTFNNVQNGTIIIAKDSIPDSDVDFAFTGDLGSFILDDDTDGTHPSSETFTDLAPGDYTVNEAVVPAWTLKTITITDNAGTVQSQSTTITLAPGETITATFVNEETAVDTGTIIVAKNSIPDSDQDFSFSGDLGLFTLDDDADGTLPFSMTFSGLIPGTYDIVEAAVPSWDLTGITIVDGTGTPNLGTRTASVTVQSGSVVTVTFTNELTTGSIVIVKDAQPDSDVDFAFTGELGPFSLDDDADPTLSNQRTFNDLAPDTYTVAETVPAGWSVEEILCTHADPVTDSNQVDIDLVAGDVVTCVFTNVEREPLPGTIIVTKNAVPDSPVDFEFAGDLGGFVLDNPSADDGDAYAFERAFFDLPAGEYTVREILPGNWKLTNIEIAGTSGTVDLANRSATVSVGDGTVTTIEFTNTENPPPGPPTPPSGGGGNRPPMPVPGDDREVCVGEVVCLDGSRSFDVDALPGAANQGVQFSWTFSPAYFAAGDPVYKIPEGSSAPGTLVNADSATPCFVPDLPGEYVLLLTVTDADGTSAYDEIRVVADPCDEVALCCVDEGWNLYSPPLHGPDPSVDALVETIGANSSVWTYAGGYAVPTAISVYGGYWLQADALTCFNAAGMAPEHGQILLESAGWHLMGVPYALRWKDVAVRFHSTTMTMNEAVRRGFISETPYCYDPVEHVYARSDTLLPCYGYWVETYQDGLELLLDRGDALDGAEAACAGPPSVAPPRPPRDASSATLSVLVTPVPAITEARFVVSPATDITSCRVTLYDVARNRLWQGEAPGQAVVWPLVRSDGVAVANGPYIYVFEVEVDASWQVIARGVMFVAR